MLFRRNILIILILFCYIHGFAQKSNDGIAPFKIRLTNGDGYTYNQLEKNKPVILIYFSPTCEHCKAFTESMLKRMSKLNNNQLVMISYVDIKEVKTFDDAYKLSNHQNIKIGSEGYTFVVQKYYNIQHFPFVAEYDKSGKLKKIIPWNLKPEEIANQL
jgi:thiol-disulfide isomerase/thioredoxin